MNRSMETFLSEVNSRKTKRRRMTALLLSLSLAVTSGVSWALRGVGLTLANDAECGIEEHLHTDDCYEQVLVCGLEEDETHTHSDACYEMQLVCGLEEHIHDTGCFLGGDGEDAAVLLRGGEAEDATDEDGTEPAAVPPKPVLRAPGDGAPSTVQTIDNIAEGIKFTLFDYGGSELESQNNRYVYRWDDENHVWTHPQSYSDDELGWKNSGINSGRDPATDILFFAMGTPVDSYCHDPDVYNYIDDNGVQHYKPDMNSYSGDYYADPVYPGNRPVTGIVDHELGADGYPKIASSGNSLAYLFAPNTYDAERGVDQSEYKTVYTDVNHLLQRDSDNGHLFYNSGEYYAYFNQDTRNFDVYDGTFKIINDNHHEEGDENNIKFDSEGNPVVYGSPKDPGFMIGFFPFDQYDNTRRDPNFDGNGYNHHFGMTMEAEFANPSKANVTNPITFEYSGDDDMWVFVDGKLVLDLGGIHEPAGGMIDFTNGLVWTQDNGNDGYSMEAVRAQLESLGVIHSDAEWEALPKPSLGTDTSSTSTGTGNKWIVKKLSDPDVYPGWDSVAHTQTHKINMFYLERGGCYSNLAMAMNLPTLRPLTVVKNVDYQQHLVKGLFEDMDYAFQVWEWDKVNGIWVIPQDTDPNGDFYLPGSSFTLKDGQRKTFEGLGQERKFKVEEKGIDPNIFEAVEVNGSPVNVLDGSAATAGAALNDLSSYTFKNKIIEETEPLRIRKVWEPENAEPPPGFDKVKFKITRTDDKTGEEKRVALVIDGVKVRTFAMTAEEWTEGVTFDGLLSRYGDHTYSYTAAELNVPRSFNASYSTDDSGAIVITNTDSKETDIYVKKKWENTAAPEPKIKLRLTRQRLRYEGSKPTQLTINILDEAGNPLMSYTTPAQVPGQTYKGVYAGGSAEFSYQLPDGVEFYADDPAYPVMTPAASDELPNPPTFKFHEDEGIIVVENLAATPNTLTFKVRTADAEDSLLLLHHSFSEAAPEKTQGWDVQNDPEKGTHAEAAADTSASYGKDGGSLLISDRTKAFNGATLHLDPAKFNGNKTYTFSAYVYSPVEDRFKMTFNNGLGGYQPIGEVTVPADTWTQITGTIKLPAEIDPYNMFLLIETLATDGNESCAASWFRVDEFTAIEGTRPVTVSETDGTVTVDNGAGSGGNGQVVYEIQFNNTTGDWVKNPGNSNVQLVTEHDNDNGFHYVAVRGRNGTGDGMRMNVPFLQKGHTYLFESFVQGDGNNNNSRVQLTIDTINGSEDGTGDRSRWQNIGGATVSNWQPGQFSETFTIPDYAKLDEMYLYYETPYGSNDNASFRVHSLRITDLTASSSPTPSDMDEQPGYDIVDDRYYVSNFDLYRIIPDENSITDPVNQSPEGYQPEANWSKEIILPDDSDDGASWTYHWDNDRRRPPGDPHRINEDSAHYLYKYTIEEIAIMKDGENWVEIDGEDEDYLISYLNNEVATNTEDNPIVVKNTYIWYRLPETGGMGTDMFYGAGLFLITTGLIGGYAFRRRERRFR